MFMGAVPSLGSLLLCCLATLLVSLRRFFCESLPSRVAASCTSVLSQIMNSYTLYRRPCRRLWNDIGSHACVRWPMDQDALQMIQQQPGPAASWNLSFRFLLMEGSVAFGPCGHAHLESRNQCSNPVCSFTCVGRPSSRTIWKLLNGSADNMWKETGLKTVT